MEALEKDVEPKQTSRIEAFSDGVFAIAITLLVLDIKVPAVKNDESLIQPLLKDWATYLGFLVGFFTILICWINHHYMFEQIRKSNGVLLLINGCKLLVVSFTPFATALLAKYIGTPHQQLVVTIYALNFAFMGLSMTGIWVYASRNRLNKPISQGELKATSLLYLFAGVFSTTIFLLSFATTMGGLALSFIMFFIFMLPGKAVSFLKRRQNRDQLVVEAD